MNLTTRRFLYFFTVILFIVAAPVILSLSRGKHFDFSTLRFTETGGIYIKWLPKNSTLVVNNELISKKSPARIRYINPGIYDIQLTKSNHYDFKTSVNVESGKAVLLDPIELFANFSEFQPTIRNVENVFSSPFDSRLLLEQKNAKGEYQLLIKKAGSIKNLFTNSDSIKRVIWSQTGNILFENASMFAVYDNEREMVFGPYNGIRFSSFSAKDPDSFFATHENSIIKITYTTNTVERIGFQGTDFLEMQNHRILIKKSGSDSLIFVANEFGNFEKIDSITGYQSMLQITPDLALIQTTNASYLLEPSSHNLIHLRSVIATYKISGADFFYASDFEVWKMTLATHERSLLSRLSEKVIMLDVSPKKSALFLSTSTSVIVHYIGLQGVSQIKIQLPETMSRGFYRTEGGAQYSISSISNGNLAWKIFSL